MTKINRANQQKVRKQIEDRLTSLQTQDDFLDDIAALTDPNADRVLGWDDSAGAVAFFAPTASIITSATALQLSGDSASPGNSKYYGTNGSGTKGYHDLPSGGGATFVGVSGNTTLTLASVTHGAVYSNTTINNYTISLPTPTASDRGLQFYVSTASAFAGTLTLNHSGGTNTLLRDETGTSGPHTVTNGTALVTVAQGAFSAYYYSISGWWS